MSPATTRINQVFADLANIGTAWRRRCIPSVLRRKKPWAGDFDSRPAKRSTPHTKFPHTACPHWQKPPVRNVARRRNPPSLPWAGLRCAIPNYNVMVWQKPALRRHPFYRRLSGQRSASAATAFPQARSKRLPPLGIADFGKSLGHVAAHNCPPQCVTIEEAQQYRRLRCPTCRPARMKSLTLTAVTALMPWAPRDNPPFSNPCPYRVSGGLLVQRI